MNNDLLLQLYNRSETVFTVHEVSQLFPHISYESLWDRLAYFTRVGKLIRPHHGMYSKPGYNMLELANKLYTPSYVSLETVLAKHDVIFQYYETIFLISYLTRQITVNDVHIQYRQLKGEILTNTKGIEQTEGYFVATLERAFLDAVYIYKDYHFDNLGSLNWEKIEILKTIYKNKEFEKRVDAYYHLFKEDYVKH